LLLAVLVMAIAGCGTDAAASPAGRAPAPSASPYDLYTHCGIGEANVDDRWYLADTPLSDGSGNPPAGWGNPYQAGTITFLSPTRFEFSDSVGHHVAFTVRPGATAPLQICS
jgi:hypothetical protein